MGAAPVIVAAKRRWGRRHARHEVARLAPLAGLRTGLSVADVGSGNGNFALALLAAVAPTGRVFVSEMPRRFARLSRRLARRAPEIAPVPASETHCGLPADEFDAVFLRDVYHHLTQPETFNDSLRAALRPEGRLVVIDFPPRRLLSLFGRPSGVPADRGGHGVAAELAERELLAAGFRLLERVPRWRGDRYCLLLAPA